MYWSTFKFSQSVKLAIPVTLILLILFPCPAFEQEINRTRFSFEKPELNLHILGDPKNLDADIVLTKVPRGMFLNGDETDEELIKWDPDIRCTFHYSAIPGNRDPGNYPNTIMETGSGQLTLNPAKEGIETGVYYCILISDEDPSMTSVEFTVIVQASSSAVPTGPIGTINLQSGAPKFEWGGIGGVPYYFLFLSESKISIERNEEGDVTGLAGLNLIWQLITSETSATFGDPDPSGNFTTSNVPPLLPGVEYNWIVLNAYGPSTALISTVAPLAPSFFSVTRNMLGPAPELIQPVVEAEVADDEIVFQWEPVTGASRYRVFLYETGEYLGNTIKYVLWSQVTSQPEVHFNTVNSLVKTDYAWRVIAEEGDRISASELRPFRYTGTAAWAKFTVSSAESLLSRVTIKVKNEADASVSLLPAVTDTFGITKIPLPAGTYSFNASKPGFQTTQDSSFEVSDDTTEIKVNLVRGSTTVSGQIVDETGSGVFDATVEVTSGDRTQSITSDFGGYFWLALSPGSWTLRVDKRGFVSLAKQDYILQQNETLDIGQLTLLPATNTINGAVTFAADGRPLQGALIRAQKSDLTFETTTDNQGRYSFTLGPGDWQIHLDSRGFFASPLKHEFALNANQTLSANFQLFSGSLIYGNIRHQGLPIEEVNVRAFRGTTGELVQSVFTNVHGNYSLGLREGGEYDIVTVHPSFLTQKSRLSITPGETQVVDFDLSEAGFVSGTVKHANTSEPLEGATVFIVEDTTNQITTGSDGEYVLGVPPNTPLNLDVSLSGFTSPGPFSINVAPGDTLPLPILLTPISAGIVRGQITNDRFVPIPNATVTVLETNRQVISNANGEFELELQPGSYTLEATKECHVTSTLALSIEAGEIKEVSISLEELKSLVSGRVTDTNGAPIADVFLEAVRVSGEFEAFDGSTGPDGMYEICLSGGQYNIEARHPGYESAEIFLQINDGQIRQNVDFVLQDNFASVAGVVTEQNDNPVADAVVVLTNDLQVLRDTTDAAGAYEIERIYPDRVSRIRPLKEGFYGRSQEIYLFGMDQAEKDLLLYPANGFIRGTVRSANDNTPIPDVIITAKFSEESGLFFKDTTNANGSYNITNLPVVPNASYTVSAFKPLFDSDPISSVPVNSTDVDFLMIPLGGIIAGTIQDIDTKLPIEGAGVKLSGVTQTITSDSTGRFKFTGLDSTELYDVSVTKDGYFQQNSENLATGDTSVVIEMLRRYAFVKGTVTDSNGLAMPTVKMLATPVQSNSIGVESQTFTDSDGRYTLRLIADEYTVRPVKLNHLSEPPNIPVELSQDSTVTGIDFVVKLHQVSFINIPGATRISNLAAPCLEADARDGSNKPVNIGSPKWTLDVSPHAATIDTMGCLNINPEYFGKLTVRAEDPISHVVGTLQIDVFAPVDSTTERSFFDDRGMQFVMPQKSVNSNWSLFNFKQPVSPAKKGRGILFISDSSYVIDDVTKSPILFNRDNPPLLMLTPPQNSEGQERFISRWDPDSSKWNRLDGQLNQQTGMIESRITQAGEYVAASIARPLAIDNFTMTPNPFSPFQEIDGRPGLKIQFDVSSDAAPNPLLTLKIYNIEGNLVRLLHEQTPFPRGRNVVFWDGKADNGALARNGRYLVRLILEDPGDEKDTMKSVVLIK